jgi:hypothetical protein
MILASKRVGVLVSPFGFSFISGWQDGGREGLALQVMV